MASYSLAQTLPASSSAAPIATTVCAISGDPKGFAGKTVTLHATIIINHIYEAVADPEACRGKEVFLGYSDDRQMDAMMKQFDDALQAQFVPIHHQAHACEYGSCPQYTVSAVMSGVVDYPAYELGQVAPRFELVSVLQVTPKENTFDPKLFRRP